MAAPVSIAHTHVHSMRTASGAEALVARVLTEDGVAGFGFTLNLEAVVARDMAAWDAVARSRRLPLYVLYGKKMRERVAVEANSARSIDPFELGSVEAVRKQPEGETRLLAPNGHPWELAFCAALAATLAGDVCIAVPGEPLVAFVAVTDAPGIGIDWSLEPGFGALRWIP